MSISLAKCPFDSLTPLKTDFINAYWKAVCYRVNYINWDSFTHDDDEYFIDPNGLNFVSILMNFFHRNSFKWMMSEKRQAHQHKGKWKMGKSCNLVVCACDIERKMLVGRCVSACLSSIQRDLTGKLPLEKALWKICLHLATWLFMKKKLKKEIMRNFHETKGKGFFQLVCGFHSFIFLSFEKCRKIQKYEK